MKLVTFGCSWVFGDELIPREDEVKLKSSEYRNSNNLGGIIFQDCKFSKYINYAGNGASNERIITQLLEYVNSNHYDKSDLFLIGLSSPLRKLEFINELNIPLTIPHWNEMHLQSDIYDTQFKKWFNSDGYYTINDRNDIIRYFTNCTSIKNIIGNNNCIVFQSIDNIHDMYENDKQQSGSWAPAIVSTSINTEEWVDIPVTKLFDINVLETELDKNTHSKQFWLNSKIESWKTYLENLEKTDNSFEYFATDYRLHPNRRGSEVWYSNVLKKYINKVLDI